MVTTRLVSYGVGGGGCCVGQAGLAWLDMVAIAPAVLILISQY